MHTQPTQPDRNAAVDVAIATEVIDSFVARQVAQRDQIAGNTRLAHAIEALHATTGWSPDRIATAIGRRRIDPDRAPAAILASRCLAAITAFHSKPVAAEVELVNVIPAPRERTLASNISMLSMPSNFIAGRLLLAGPTGPSDAPRALGAVSAVAMLILVATFGATVIRDSNVDNVAAEVVLESALPSAPNDNQATAVRPVPTEPVLPAGPSLPVVEAPASGEVPPPIAEPVPETPAVQPPLIEAAPVAEQPVAEQAFTEQPVVDEPGAGQAEPATITDRPMENKVAPTPQVERAAQVAATPPPTPTPPAPAPAPATPAPAVEAAPQVAPTPAPVVEAVPQAAPAPAPVVEAAAQVAPASAPIVNDPAGSIAQNAESTQAAISADIAASQQSTTDALNAQFAASTGQVNAALGQPALGIPTASFSL
jgi:hypothetical protein